MGQQQLLLLVLGIVIVGLATVVGVQSFQENARKSSIDRMTAQAVDYAGKMIEWKLKPSAQGGGQAATGMTGFTLANLGLVEDQTVAFLGSSTSNWAASGDVFVSLWETAGAVGAPHVAVHDTKYDVSVSIFVHGTKPECFVQRISYMESGSRVDTPTMWPANPDATNCSL